MTLTYLMTVTIFNGEKKDIDWIKFYYFEGTGLWLTDYTYPDDEWKTIYYTTITDYCCGPICRTKSEMIADIKHNTSLYKEYWIENCSMIVPTPKPTLMPTMTPLPTPEPTPLPTPIIMFVRETCNIQKPWQIISMLTSLFMTGDD